MKQLIALAAVIALCLGCKSSRVGQPLTHHAAQTHTMRTSFRIGETNLNVLVFQHGPPSPTFINVHDDENTSVAAGKTVIEQTGGRLIELSHSGERNVRFTLNGERFAFDPNRIFSEAGIRATLKYQSHFSEAAQHAVKRFAAQWLERFALDREPVIIALHNNTERALTIHSYEPGHEHATTSKAVHIAPTRSPDDFFYVTDERFFDYLKQRDFNVTLQDNTRVPDDGSLSVYFGQRGIPYINIEAEISHLNAQIEMVRVAREMAEEFGLVKKP